MHFGRDDAGRLGCALARCVILVEPQRAVLEHRRAPAGEQHDGRDVFGEQCRARERIAGRERVAAHERHVGPGAVDEHGDARTGLDGRVGPAVCLRVADGCAVFRDAHGLDGDRFHHEGLRFHHEAESFLMECLEGRFHRACVAERHFERGVGVLVLEASRAQRAHTLARYALGEDLFDGRALECLIALAQCRHGLIVEHRLDSLLAQHAQIGQTHAESRKHACERMQHDAPHAERLGHGASGLTARAAERAQRVVGHVMAAFDRNLLDRLRHVVDGDRKEAFGHGFGAHRAAGLGAHARRERFEFFADGRHVERQIAVRPEDVREMIGLHAAEHDVAVGHG